VVVIKDYMESKASHTVEQCFHLSPECVVKKSDKNRYRISNGDEAIELLIDEQVKAEFRKAGEDPISGWASCSYDRKQPATTIVCRTICDGNQCLTTRIKLSIQN